VFESEVMDEIVADSLALGVGDGKESEDREIVEGE